jgi:hypothetical protein
MLGFRGHFVTKSRGYSTNLGTLRATRAAYRARRTNGPTTLRSTTMTRRSCCPSGSTSAPATSTPATRSWRPASRHPYGPPAKRCSIYEAGHRKQALRANGLISGRLIRRSTIRSESRTERAFHPKARAKLVLMMQSGYDQRGVARRLPTRVFISFDYDLDRGVAALLGGQLRRPGCGFDVETGR